MSDDDRETAEFAFILSGTIEVEYPIEYDDIGLREAAVSQANELLSMVEMESRVVRAKIETVERTD